MSAICNGRGKQRIDTARCPWCSVRADTEGQLPASLITEIFDGYVAPDIVCGRCGYKWTPDDDGPIRDQPDEKRQVRLAEFRAALAASDEGR